MDKSSAENFQSKNSTSPVFAQIARKIFNFNSVIFILFSMLIVSVKRNHQLEIILKSALESEERVNGTHSRNATVRKTIYPKPLAKSPVSSKKLRLDSKMTKARQKQLGIAPKIATINLNDSNAIFNDFNYREN